MNRILALHHLVGPMHSARLMAILQDASVLITIMVNPRTVDLNASLTQIVQRVMFVSMKNVLIHVLAHVVSMLFVVLLAMLPLANALKE